ncbi:MAG: MFS transporter [Sneathiellaceae bacterium]
MTESGRLPGTLPILIGAAVMMTLTMGLRQSLGIFMQPAVQDIAITISEFTLAIAVQNLLWGLFQPFAGAAAVRWGYRPIMLGGAAAYAAGLFMLAGADGLVMVIVGAGLCIGIGMACASVAMAMSVTAQSVSAARRSTMLGVMSAAGSIGTLIAAPIGQLLQEGDGWRVGVLGFAVLALLILPAAWFAGRVDKAAPIASVTGAADGLNAWAAVGLSFRHGPFMVMAAAYFVCGMQLIFLTTHLPAYLELCGMDPMLGATALGTIGGFNVLGSLFFGWAGGRWNKRLLLGGIYVLRSGVLAWYFLAWPTPETTILFAAMMGFLWLGVSPLVAGLVVEMFGLRWQAMIQGLAFMSHQVGSFLGAFGGGWLFDRMGSYDLALQIGVGIGLAAGIVQMLSSVSGPAGLARPA